MNINTSDTDYDLHLHHKLKKSKTTYHKHGLTGLVNLGNRCFMNSIIQCLSNTLKLTDFFLSGTVVKEMENIANKNTNEVKVVIAWYHLVKNIWQHNQLIKPKTIIDSVSKIVPKYSSLTQQDSHEFLVYLLEILDKGLGYEIDVEIKGTIKKENDILMKEFLENWKKYYEKQYSHLVELFHGMFYNRVSCQNCDFFENIFEPYNTISLSIPISANSIQLETCLDNYFNTNEIISSWCCEKCNGNGCSKEINYWTIPNYLIIHLKRFTNTGNKINTHIQFPIDNLNLTKYISKRKGDPNNYIYSLYAVNYHSGSLNGGHYWSACKNLDNSWYSFNDGDVSKVNNMNMTQIVTPQSYILFYHRKFHINT